MTEAIKVPTIYDVSEDDMRPVTQDDVDRMEQMLEIQGRLVGMARYNYCGEDARKKLLDELRQMHERMVQSFGLPQNVQIIMSGKDK